MNDIAWPDQIRGVRKAVIRAAVYKTNGERTFLQRHGLFVKGRDNIADLCGDHFPHFVPAPTIWEPSGWYGNAVLSRFPVSRYNVTDITEKNRSPRNIQEVFLDTPHGQLHA